MGDEHLGVDEGGSRQPRENLLEQVKEHWVAVFLHQLSMKPIFEVHRLSLVVASVEKHGSRICDVPGEQEHDALERLRASVDDVPVDQVLVDLAGLALGKEDVEQVVILAV